MLMLFNLVRVEEMFQQVAEEEGCNNGNHQISDWQASQIRNPETFRKDIKERYPQKSSCRKCRDVWKLAPESQNDTAAQERKNKNNRCHQH